MKTAAAFILAAAAVYLLIHTAPTDEIATLRLFNFFVPVTLVLGIAGVVRGLRAKGWGDPVEGLIVLSLLAGAWGLDAGRAAVRRAAIRDGIQHAEALSYNDVRMATGSLLILANVLVIRWLTRREYGEWLWVTITLLWCAMLIIGDPVLQLLLSGLYVALDGVF